MATVELTASLSEIASTLDPTRIPDKLHCPICDKFLLNGYKTSCCDQAICESCYGNLADRCPMCEHQPFNQDLCKPYKAIRNTARVFLKLQEKRQAEERAKTQAATAETANHPTEVINTVTEVALDSEDVNVAAKGTMVEEVGEQHATPAVSELPLEDQPQPSIEGTSEVLVDEPAINVAGQTRISVDANVSERYDSTSLVPASAEQAAVPMNGEGASGKVAGFDQSGLQSMMNMNAGFPNMDMNQMMQFMAANGMNGFNPMMGMPNMGINPISQGMFGAFGGPGAGMNGMNSMNMGMNFPASQGMYGNGWNSQPNNMWNGPQNNNPNAFSNGMGGDFGPNAGYGYNVSQQGNFNQQQYPNGDFQNGNYGRGYGRGRGRGRGRERGGFGGTRGGYNQYSQGNPPAFQNAHEQQQYEIQNMQAAMMDQKSSINGDKGADGAANGDESPKQQDDEFAPGGQEEVQEALGGDYNKSVAEETLTAETSATESAVLDGLEATASREADVKLMEETNALDEKAETETTRPIPVASPTTYDADAEPLTHPPETDAAPEAHQEVSVASMPPPSAPLGPAAQYSEPIKDFGFRGRGNGRFGSRGRVPIPPQNGLPVSPARTLLQPQTPVSPNEIKGTGVVGAPTGPKAMREPPKVPAATRGNGGFQIVGRASMASHQSQPFAPERSRSRTPSKGGRSRSPSPSRHESRRERQTSSRYEADGLDDYDRERDRKRRKSRRDVDHEVPDTTSQHRERSPTPEESHKSSHRSHREKDRHSSKHHSSRSRRHRDEVSGDTDHNVDDYGEPVEAPSRSSHRAHRSSKPSKHDERDRDRERDREERHRDRKRSRHDRDKEEADVEEDEPRHRSRRHKSHHGKDEPSTNGKHSHRSSKAATPVAEAVDPHTLEREARNRERMLKEQQRREKAMNVDSASGGRRSGGGGRRVSYKYEDEAQSAMVEQEREAARWR